MLHLITLPWAYNASASRSLVFISSKSTENALSSVTDRPKQTQCRLRCSETLQNMVKDTQ